MAYDLDSDFPCTLYKHYDADGRLLYVGITFNALSRHDGHRYHAPWYREIATITLRHFPNRRDAAAEEQQIIEIENPIHNKVIVSGRKRRPTRVLIHKQMR